MVLWASLTPRCAIAFHPLNPFTFFIAISQLKPPQVVEEEKSRKEPKLDTLDIILVKAKESVGVEADLSVYVNMDERLDKADEDGDGKTSVAELKKVR